MSDCGSGSRGRRRVATSWVLTCFLVLGCSTGTGSIQDRDWHYPVADAQVDAQTDSAIPLNEMDAALGQVDPVSNPAPVDKPYKGFHLTGMFMVAYGPDNHKGYAESDFSLMRELGFNWVRLPIDYLTYTTRSDWYSFVLEGLRKIDQAVEFGQKYGVHVCLNLYQAPGYSVATLSGDTGVPDDQKLDLWTSDAAQKAFATHWGMFATRYQKIPAKYLSFNLVNEPPSNDAAATPHIDENAYVGVMKQATDAIRQVSPERPILVDGLSYGSVPLKSLADADPTIIQSVHDYSPIQLTHYQASWVDVSNSFAPPQWPIAPMARYLWGPLSGNDPIKTALQFDGAFPAGTQVTINVHQVSTTSQLVAQADGQTTNVIDHVFQNGPNDSDATEYESTVWENNTIFQDVYDKEYSGTLSAAAGHLSITLAKGDWLEINSVRLALPEEGGTIAVTLSPTISRWDVPQASYVLTPNYKLELSSIPDGYDAEFDWKAWLNDWKNLASSGVQVMVGEFGVYNHTPEDVTLAWMKDQLTVFDQSSFNGWATWDPFSEFGVFGSPRPGETPEIYAGHPLNRPMLDLLQQY